MDPDGRKDGHGQTYIPPPSAGGGGIKKLKAMHDLCLIYITAHRKCDIVAAKRKLLHINILMLFCFRNFLNKRLTQ